MAASLEHEIHETLKQPSLLDKLRTHAGKETDEFATKGKGYVAEKIINALPTEQKLGSAFVSMLDGMHKRAGVLGTALNAARSAPGAIAGVARGMGAESRGHLNEVAGLGVLAVPGLDTLQAKARARLAGDKTEEGATKRQFLGEGGHAALDVGGLGMLAAPEFKHISFKHAFVSSAYGGNTAQNPPGMRGHSKLPSFVVPELEHKTANVEEVLFKKMRASGLSSAEADKRIGEGKTAAAVAKKEKDAGMGVGAGMSTSSYSGRLSDGHFKMTSGAPPFTSPAFEQKQAEAFSDELGKIAGGMNTATDAMHAAGRLHATQSVGAPKVTAPAGPSIADIAKPKGFGTPISGAKKNML